ncbi:distal tail protein Dit, partial [Pseudogracilibacillus auburnensis]|uniref:distal tail protein Dit n=1 Tax=Pseudogracilibacillus auburnensis TaxID=1494959 RepID=UPI001A966D76
MRFNGIKKDYITVLRGRKRPPWAPVERDLITVPGMPGAYLSGTSIKPRIVTVPVLIRASTFPHLQKLKEDLAAWLVTNEVVPLEFEDEPDRVYYALVDEQLDLDELVRWGEGIISFICLDPFKYGTEKNLLFPADTVSLENKGTAETEPIFTFNVLEDTTFAMVSNGEEYMMVGRPADALEAPKNTRPLILNDPASTLVGWSNFTGGFDFYGLGLVGGKMKVHGGYAFTPDTWGTNPNGWTGPAIRKSLSEPLQDFEVEVDLAMLNRASGVGRTVIVGLDDTDKPVFSMDMTDATNGYPNNRSTFRLGNNLKTWFSYQGDKNQR